MHTLESLMLLPVSGYLSLSLSLSPLSLKVDYTYSTVLKEPGFPFMHSTQPPY